MKQGVVQSQGNDSFPAECLDQKPSQRLPQTGHIPPGIGKETVVGGVSPKPRRIDKWEHAGDGSPCLAQHPACHQSSKNIGSRGGENRKKLLKKFRPCRCNCMHIDLPVLIVYPIKTSAGRYVFDKFPLKLVA
jgi:hypothetical protein